MTKVLVIDGKPDDPNCKFVNFTSDPGMYIPVWDEHATDILNCFSDSSNTLDLTLDLIFCQVVENYIVDSNDYMSDTRNHANLNRALLWAIEQGIEYVYIGFFFYAPRNSKLNKATNSLAKRIKIFCASENNDEEYKESSLIIKKKAMSYCPSKKMATYVSATSRSWPGTVPSGDDWTSRLTATAVVEAIHHHHKKKDRRYRKKKI